MRSRLLTLGKVSITLNHYCFGPVQSNICLYALYLDYANEILKYKVSGKQHKNFMNSIGKTFMDFDKL